MAIKHYVTRFVEGIRYEFRSNRRLRRQRDYASLLFKYGAAFLCVAVVFELKLLTIPWMGADAPFLLVLIAVMLSSFFGGFGPGLFATALSAYFVHKFYLDGNEGSAVQDTAKIAFFLIEGAFVSALNSLRLYAERKEQEFDYRVKASAQVIKHQNTHDLLTGFANRKSFDFELNKALANCKTNKEQLAIFYIDLDRFKKVNETLGHNIGDIVLKEVSNRFRNAVGDKGLIARLGGDEFAVMIPRLKNKEQASMVAKDMLNSLNTEIIVDEFGLHVGASIGIAFCPDDGETPAILLRNADHAAYRAKQKGRGIYQIYNKSMNLAAPERLTLENDLRYAVQLNQFSLLYQPIYDLNAQQVQCAEVLLRWNHPKLGVLLPYDFLSLADEGNVLVALSEWILDEACKKHVLRMKHGFPPIRLSINFSAKQFSEPEFLERIPEIVKRNEMDPRLLQLEITEEAAMKNVDFTISMIDSLQASGISIAIDDFGTGYSSLNYLKRFPIDTLKIDKSFVTTIAKNDEDAAIVYAIISLAHSLKIKVVAEGVENKEQMDLLKKMECDAVQGYYLSTPLEEHIFMEWLQKKEREGMKH
jgi:diguanylate cyclase (GGDEF)-like protein